MSDRSNDEPDSTPGSTSGTRAFWRRMLNSGERTLLITMFVLVGAVTLLVGASMRSNASASTARGLALQGAPLIADTPVLPPPTDTPLSPPPATDTPLPAPPAATPVPLAPVVISFPCSGFILNTGATPNRDLIHLCVTTSPPYANGTVNMLFSACNGQDMHPFGVSLDNTGARTIDMVLQLSCAPPFVISIAATSVTYDGHSFSGSTTIAVNG